jgi:hypothetical protein
MVTVMGETASCPDVRLKELVRQAEQGDLSALPSLREALAASPVWGQVGDLAAKAERSWVALVSGGEAALKDALKRQLADLKAELVGPAPTPIEGLLAARVAVSYVQVHAADLESANAQVHVPESFVYQSHLDRRLSAAQRRYVEALKALASVQKLLRRGPSPVQLAGGAVPETPLPRPTGGRGRKHDAQPAN